jgi:hypothetical protein
MKTVEIPDALFRKVKAAAAEEGKSLKDFFTEAVSNRLNQDQRNSGDNGAMPWEICDSKPRPPLRGR